MMLCDMKYDFFFSGIRIKTVNSMILLILLNAQVYVYQGAPTISCFCIVLKDSKSIFVHTINDSNVLGR